jgi:hypothetical protein
MPEELILTGVVCEMWYEPSEIGVEDGIKGGCYKKHINGARVIGGGNGTFVTATQAHFNLTVLINGRKQDVQVERDFRNLLNIKRLSPKLREIIEATRPTEVEVSMREGFHGTKYYVLSDTSAKAWAQRVLAARR